MKRKVVMISLVFAAGIVVGVAVSQVLNAQQEPIKTTVLQRTDLMGVKGKEGVLMAGEMVPGGVGGKHYCTGNEFTYILKGSLILEVEGKPPVTYRPGDTFYLSPKQAHSSKNGSATAPIKVLSFAIIDKGQAINVPVN